MRFWYVIPLVLVLQVQNALAKMWPCRNGELIDESFKCDRLTDCMDGSDESSLFCEVKCKKNEFRCLDISQCISKELLCNNFGDCSDKSDENEEMCLTTSEEPLGICPSALFTCVDGSRCLHTDFLCDSNKDCDDGSDERGCEKLDIDPPVKSEPRKKKTTVPLVPFATAKKSKQSVPKVCHKKPHVKKCRKFWDILTKTLNNPKLVRKCDRKPDSKKCKKIKPLLDQHKAFMIANGTLKPKKSLVPRKCIKNPKRKSCRKYQSVGKNTID